MKAQKSKHFGYCKATAIILAVGQICKYICEYIFLIFVLLMLINVPSKIAKWLTPLNSFLKWFCV